MRRVWFLIVVLFWTLQTSAVAKVYECRTPDGETFMTDQPENLPDDCMPYESPSESKGFNIIPETKDIPLENRPEPPQRTPTNPQPWQAQATALVQNYKEAVKQRYHASLAVDQRRAIQEIGLLKEQKQQLLDDLAQSGLSRNDQDKIREILDEIPQ